jgi:putative Holliday junction resolvase
VTRLLAVDLGARRIGLAVADTETGSIRGLATINRSTAERDADTLSTLAAEHQIDELVVGLPLNMDGSEGAQAAETRGWVESVGPSLGLAVCWRDERLTSQAAEGRIGKPRRGRSGGPPSARARNSHRARVDREAAMAIAQSELDAR